MVGEPGFLFDPTGRSAPTYAELQKRRAIAQQLMMRRDKQPKNVGEGLTAIGEAIGDIGYNWLTERQAKAAQDYAATHGVLPERPAVPGYTPPAPAAAPPPTAAAPPPPAATVSDAGPPVDISTSDIGGGLPAGGGGGTGGDTPPDVPTAETTVPTPPPGGRLEVVPGPQASVAPDENTVPMPTARPAAAPAPVFAEPPPGVAKAGKLLDTPIATLTQGRPGASFIPDELGRMPLRAALAHPTYGSTVRSYMGQNLQAAGLEQTDVDTALNPPPRPYVNPQRSADEPPIRSATSAGPSVSEIRTAPPSDPIKPVGDTAAFTGRMPTEAELTDKSVPAGNRFNNPFNMWHDKYATNYGGVPGRQITPYDTPAIYPSKMAGAAGAIKKMAESPLYSGKSMNDLIGTWVGHGESYAPIIEKMTGISKNTPITREFLASDQGLTFLKAMARYETKSSEPYPLSDEQWRQARDHALGGGGAPGAPAVRTASAAPGAPAGAPPAASGNTNYDFIHQYGGHATVLQDGNEVHVHPGTPGAYTNTSPELSARLVAAGKAFQQATGKDPKYGEMARGNDVQQVYYDKYRAGKGGIAAAPGHSSHQHGNATDLPGSEFRDWLYAGNADKFGLHFPVYAKTGKDKPHVEMNPRYAGANFATDADKAVASAMPPGHENETPAQHAAHSAPAASPRERVAVAAMRNPTALTSDDIAQEDRFSDVLGMRPPGSFNYPATALNRTGDVQSDAPDPGVSPVIADQIAETLGARRNAIAGRLTQPPIQSQPPTQPPTPLSVADPAVSTAPPVVDQRLAQKASGTVSDAPPSFPRPSAAGSEIPAARPLSSRPADPQFVQPDKSYLQRLDAISRDPRLDPQVQARAAQEARDYQAQIQHTNDQRLQQYNKDLDRHLNETDPKNVYATEAARRQLMEDGGRPMTEAEARKLYPGGVEIPKGQALWWDGKGNPKFGPVGTTVNIDQKQEGAEAASRGQLAAKAERELLDTASKSGEDLYNIRRAQAVLKRINTGMGSEANMTVSQYAQAVGLPKGFTDAMGLKPDQIADKQVFQAISNQLTLGNLGSGGMPTNNFSNTDREFVNKIVTNLGDDERSNHIKLEVAAAAKQRNIEKMEAWSDYREAHSKDGKPASFTDFEFSWNKSIRNKDVLGHIYKEAEEILNSPVPSRTGPAAPPPGAPQAPQQPPQQEALPRVNSDADMMKVPPNGLYIAPDGSTRRRGR